MFGTVMVFRWGKGVSGIVVGVTAGIDLLSRRRACWRSGSPWRTHRAMADLNCRLLPCENQTIEYVGSSAVRISSYRFILYKEIVRPPVRFDSVGSCLIMSE